MPTTKTKTRTVRSGSPLKGSIDDQAEEVVARLKRLATKSTRDGMARYGIPNDNAFGVTVSAMRKLAKSVGGNHELALATWEKGWYEARMIAVLLDEPARVTPSQMETWCRDFDSWAICDTACFCLFDRTPHALAKVKQWSTRRDEFQKRAAFALLACVGLHDKEIAESRLADFLPLIERAATDDRNFVMKGVSWALRVVGGRSLTLNKASIELSDRLVTSPHKSARWIGRDALRELKGPRMTKRFAARSSSKKRKRVVKD